MARLATLAFVVAMTACGTAYADELPTWDVSDRPAPVFFGKAASAIAEKPAIVPESQPEPITDVFEPEYEYTPTEAYYEPYTAPESYTPTDGLTKEGGINYYGGRLETWYSSQVLPHYQMGEWSTDEEGFYRTDEGYYVVAASDMEQGTVFEGSKGECIVLDSGCADGTTDYYVAW